MTPQPSYSTQPMPPTWNTGSPTMPHDRVPMQPHVAPTSFALGARNATFRMAFLRSNKEFVNLTGTQSDLLWLEEAVPRDCDPRQVTKHPLPVTSTPRPDRAGRGHHPKDVRNKIFFTTTRLTRCQDPVPVLCRIHPRHQNTHTRVGYNMVPNLHITRTEPPQAARYGLGFTCPILVHKWYCHEPTNTTGGLRWEVVPINVLSDYSYQDLKRPLPPKLQLCTDPAQVVPKHHISSTSQPPSHVSMTRYPQSATWSTPSPDLLCRRLIIGAAMNNCTRHHSTAHLASFTPKRELVRYQRTASIPEPEGETPPTVTRTTGVRHTLEASSRVRTDALLRPARVASFTRSPVLGLRFLPKTFVLPTTSCAWHSTPPL